MKNFIFIVEGITIHSNAQDEYEELLEKVYLPIEGAD